MSKKYTNSLLLMAVVILLSSCKTVDKTVEKMVFQRNTETLQKTDPYKSSFIKNVQGSYKMIDDKTFTIDGTGFFTLDETEFFLHETLSESKAIYVSAEPVANSRKKVYTYHGIISTEEKILSVAHKAPTGDGIRLLTEKDTEYAWAVNTFQVKNINWETGLSTVFGTKTDSPQK